MMFRAIALLLLSSTLFASIVQDVRSEIAKGDFAAGERLIAEYRKSQGVTPEAILALSWLGRGALAAKQFEKADTYAAETRKLALTELKKRPLDAEKDLPLALGASIEVQSQAAAALGERDQAVKFLKEEIARWKGTSIITRLNKNLNLLTLEGKAAPVISPKDFLGGKAPLKGQPLLLFLWAHWCGDCKGQAPILARIQKEHPGLAIVGLTQRYGYAAGGREVSPAEELKYIDHVRQTDPAYKTLPGMPVAVSEEMFSKLGASSTPTIILVDSKGIVQMYHPGRMPYEELSARVATLK
jgi:thiol-disulfide isomerase/thioredoxin